MESFVLHVLKLNILAAVIILLVKVAALFLEKRFTAQWKYLIWLVLALSLLIPARLPSELSLVQLQVQVPDQSFEEKPAPAQTAGQQDAALKGADSAGGRRELALFQNGTALLFKVFFVVWIAVAVLRVLGGAAGYLVTTKRLRRMSIPVYNSFTQNAYRTVCRREKIGHPPRLMQNAGLSTPLLTGILRPELYLPAIGYTAEELKLIFHHELAHYRRKDLWYKLLLKLCASVYWFNPFLLIMLKEAENDIENLCDTHVVRSCSANDHRLYRRLLLKTVAMQNRIPYVTASLNDSTMVFKDRILYMVNLKRLKKSPLPGVMLALLLVLSNAAFSLSAAAESDRAGRSEAETEQKSGESPELEAGTSAVKKERDLVNMVNDASWQEDSGEDEAAENADAAGANQEAGENQEVYGNESYEAPSEDYGNSESYDDPEIYPDQEPEQSEEPVYEDEPQEENGGNTGISDPYDLYSWDAGTNSYIPYQAADGEGYPVGRGAGWYYYDEASGMFESW